ncbi:MAG: DNA repair protein [Acidimicrobiales bacterium]|nr:DNA repair protein [Acidimicrobiales bacterium]
MTEADRDPHVDRGVEFERIALDDTSWVDVARGWVAGAEEVGEHLLKEVAWRTSSVYRYDHRVEQRRLAAGWSRGTPLPHPVLAEATRVLQHRYGVTFDGFTMMQYRDGSDGQGFHRDTDMRWLDDTLIAVLSFGAQRPWLLKPVGSPRFDDGFDGRPPARVIDIAPGPGDLLVLGGRCQADWMHSVAYQSGRPLAPRVSIQWRHVKKTGKPHVGTGYAAPRTFGERPNRAR